MAFKLKYNFNGPPDNHVLIKQRGNNATLSSVNPMPQQFYPSSNDSVFAMGRRAFIQTKGEPNGPNNTDNKGAGTVRGNFGTTFNQMNKNLFILLINVKHILYLILRNQEIIHIMDLVII